MEEFEIFDGIADLFAEGAEAGGAMEDIGAAVEDNAAVEEVAAAPEIAGPESQGPIRDFITNNPYGQKMWAFAKWAGTTAAGAAAAFAIMYGLNKAAAKNAHESGNRTALSDYLVQVAANFQKNNLPWTDELRQEAAKDALAFPWIDATK